MLIILDTSVLVSQLFSRGKSYTRDIIMLARAKKVSLAVSTETLMELKQTLQSDSIKHMSHYNSRIIGLFVVWYQYNSQSFSLSKGTVSKESRDTDDIQFIRLAEASQADYLISLDKDLLILKSINSTKIVTPEQFMRNEFPRI